MGARRGELSFGGSAASACEVSCLELLSDRGSETYGLIRRAEDEEDDLDEEEDGDEDEKGIFSVCDKWFSIVRSGG